MQVRYYLVCAVVFVAGSFVPNELLADRQLNSKPNELAILLPHPAAQLAPFRHIRKIKCTCGTTTKELEEPSCAAGKKATCVCNPPGNNPTIECRDSNTGK